jgi:apolipoprotein N-acyltransferase
VGLVQAGVGSHAKRDAERRREGESRRSREAYEAGTRRAAAAGAELIVWPETALVEGARVWDAARGRPFPAADVDLHLRRLGYGFLPEVGRDRALLLGGYADEDAGAPGPDGKRTRRFNVAMLREAGGADWSIYRKVKLMPFGETMPGSSVVPSLADLLPQSFRMAAGSPDQPPIAWKARDLRICAFVCYESILPGLVARLAGDRRPDLLVNLTNDSWYGDTWEPHQHLNFARFRAVEHRAPMLRATNTGISAIVSATGEVTHRLPYDVAGEIVADVPLVAWPRTLYATIAPALPWGLWLAALAALAATVRRPRGRTAPPSAPTPLRRPPRRAGPHREGPSPQASKRTGPAPRGAGPVGVTARAAQKLNVTPTQNEWTTSWSGDCAAWTAPELLTEKSIASSARCTLSRKSIS